jgi:hypothetical protein
MQIRVANFNGGEPVLVIGRGGSQLGQNHKNFNNFGL